MKNYNKKGIAQLQMPFLTAYLNPKLSNNNHHSEIKSLKACPVRDPGSFKLSSGLPSKQT